jgi:potassium-transporting ATPase ATP-binding subunit
MSKETSMLKTRAAMFDTELVLPAIGAAFQKLTPRVQWRNPVMFLSFISVAY